MEISLYCLLFLCSMVLMVDTLERRNVGKEETSMNLFIRQQLAALSSKLEKIQVVSYPKQVVNQNCQKSLDESDRNNTTKEELANLRTTIMKSNKLASEFIKQQQLVNKINQEASEKIQKELETIRQNVQKTNHQILLEIGDLKNRLTAIQVKENPNNKSCGSNWVLHDGHCYFYGSSLKTWNDAENDCKQQNSHLVKVEGASENKWIYEQMKVKGWSNMWMGASDTEKEGEYKWVKDGSKFDYTNFHQGQPDNYGNREDCIGIWDDDRWNDAPCYLKCTYLCEKDLNK